MTSSRFASFAGTLIAAWCAGCAPLTPTEIVVTVATDIPVPQEMDKLRLEVVAGKNSPQVFEYGLDPSAPDYVALPGTLGLNAVEHPSHLDIGLALTGLKGEKALVTRKADINTSRGESILVRMDLLMRCAYRIRPCSSRETCGEEGCMDPWESTEVLKVHYDSEDLERDLPRYAESRWVPVQAGVLRMGSPPGEPCRETAGRGKETQRTVTLTRAFEIAATEVTQAQYRILAGESPTLVAACGDDCPVEGVTWHGAAAYCNLLSLRRGFAPCYSCSPRGALTCADAAAFAGDRIYDCPGYRLPTEAEWELAYRAGAPSALYNGSLAMCEGVDVGSGEIAWYKGNAASATHPVAQRRANVWGLYDMAGNVAEWVHDGYLEDLGLADASNPVGPVGAPEKVVRGGSCVSEPGELRAASRGKAGPASVGLFGLRCVRSL